MLYYLKRNEQCLHRVELVDFDFWKSDLRNHTKDKGTQCNERKEKGWIATILREIKAHAFG